MKYYVIAGEASGDLHGSNLLKQINLIDDNSNFRCWGGDLMKAQNAVIVKHYKELAFMGFTEVIFNLRTILNNIDFCKKDILAFKPDVLVLIDYPGFNLRIAEFAHEHKIKVVYYISPQVWAWKQSRVHKIKRVVNKMLTILPFEKEFYKKFNFEVEFVGHPLIDAIANYENSQKQTFSNFCISNNLSEKPIIAILPGSRSQEIKTMLPLMLGAAKKFSDYQLVIAAAPSQLISFYESIVEKSDNVKIVQSKTYELLSHSSAALVTSGTATLETALFNVPQVVCYKGSKISYLIARQLIKVKYISLVNLILDTEAVKELIQDNLNEKNIEIELGKIFSEQNKMRIMGEYQKLKKMLGGEGASENAARFILKTANE